MDGVSPRAIRRHHPSVASRDAGRARLGRLTGWMAAGGAAGVGLFSVFAASSSAAKTSTVPSDPTVVSQPGATSGAGAEAPATVPPTVPTTAPNSPSYTLPAITEPAPILQPVDPPTTSGRRHHRQDAAATSGGS